MSSVDFLNQVCYNNTVKREVTRKLSKVFRKVGAMTPKQYLAYRKAEKSKICRVPFMPIYLGSPDLIPENRD
jgi:hypothetical protein